MLEQKTNSKRVVWLSIALLIIAIVTIYSLINGGLFGSSVISVDTNMLTTGGFKPIATTFDAQTLSKLKYLRQWVNENILDYSAPAPKDNPFVPPLTATGTSTNTNINAISSR